jgi:hypothetical protein
LQAWQTKGRLNIFSDGLWFVNKAALSKTAFNFNVQNIFWK